MIENARLALEGLSVGDAFGENFFRYDKESAALRIQHRDLPSGEWRYTDDTNMALSIYRVLCQKADIDQDALILSFAAHYNPARGYGAGAGRLLRQVGAGGHWWRDASYSLFEGQGSFGNGAAMRIAPIGGYFADDLEQVVTQATKSSEVTHAHPEGIAGGIAVAVAAAMAYRLRGTPPPTRSAFIEMILPYVPEGEVKSGLRQAQAIQSTHVDHAARMLGNGLLISAQDTVPFCLWCAGEYLGSFEEAMWQTVAAFGDIDTNCAIVGGIVALYVGQSGIPSEWIQRREPLPDWAIDMSM
ncbi:MAG: ADP-ribosylglycohydrolase family protein [Chloroflexi bacterium]|nr:ADP-ribosylglycohydrolase family protein [Chloroflexota bacterium]